MRVATLELKLEALVHALERRYRDDQPHVPAGNSDGGQWTRVGGSQGEGRIRTTLAGVLVMQRVGVGEDRLIRHCIYQDMFGRQFGFEQDAAKPCPPTYRADQYFGSF